MATLTFGNILGGVNYSAPPGEIPALNGTSFYLADGQNVVPTLNGYATKRGGSSIYNTVMYGTNLAPTSCCTDPDSDADVTTGWTDLPAATGTVTSETGGDTGSCLKILESGVQNPGVYKNITVVPGELWQFTGKVKSDGSEATFQAFIYDISNSANLWNPGNVESTNDWATTWDSGLIEIPAGCTSVRIQLQSIAAAASGTHTLFDDVTFKKSLPITSFHEFINSSGTAVHFCTRETFIGKYASGEFSNHVTGLTTGLYGKWLNYGDYAIYANGTDNPQKTDGTTGGDLTTDESGLAGADDPVEWGERVWLHIGSKLVGSALRAPTDFSTTTTDIGWWEGEIGSLTQPIIAKVPFFDIMIIGKQNQLYSLAGAPETASSTFRLQPLKTKDKDAIGFTSKNATAQVGNDLLFLDGFDIKRLSGVTQYGDVESSGILFNIKDYFRSSSGAGLDKDYLQNAHFFHYKHKEQIWCSIPTGASTRFWMIIDYSNPDLRSAIGLPPYSFFPMSGLTPISFGAVTNGSKSDIYAGCQDGYVRKLDTGTDDTSTAIDAHAVWSVGDPNKYIQPANVNLNIWYDTACTITPSYALGLQDWADAIDSTNYTDMTAEDLTDSAWITVGGVAQKRIDEFYANIGRSFLLKLRHNTAGQTFEMRASVLKYRGRIAYYG